MSIEKYLEMGVLGLIVWTQQLQDPWHREEFKASLSLSMDYGKQNIDITRFSVLGWSASHVELHG